MQKYQVNIRESFFLVVLFFGASLSATQTNHLNKVLYTSSLRAECVKFLDNVLRQVSSTEFFELVDTLKQKNDALTDNALYEKLIENIYSIKSWNHSFNVISSLKYQKRVLSEQAKTLLDGPTMVDGYVEIGTPATYLTSMKSFLTTTGPRYVVNDMQRWTDYIQGYSLNPRNKFKPYDHFVSLNDYDPISEDDIPSKSVDLVVCVIGLHHVPIEKLDAFIASIERILRPGGTLLLREHNAHTPELTSIISTAHSVYNAITAGETVEAEMSEYRNFQPLNYWITVLKQHGLQAGSERILQDGDPTLNTFMKFSKPVEKQDQLDFISRSAKKTKTYEKDISQTYLTSPEWHNVDIAQEYGKFINHTPFYEFPYMESVSSYWKVFLKSWNAARKKRGLLPATLSSYTLMNLFIGITMSVEFAAKSAMSLPLRMAFSGAENETIAMIVSDPKNEIEDIDERITVDKKIGEHLKLVNVPRYKEFFAIIQKLQDSSIIIHEIAGQKTIQCKVRYKKGALAFTQGIGYLKEYEWGIPTQPAYRYAALSVDVDRIRDVIKDLMGYGIEIMHIHDF